MNAVACRDLVLRLGDRLESGRVQSGIALFAITGIGLHLLLRMLPVGSTPVGQVLLTEMPLIAVLSFGGTTLVVGLLCKLIRRQYGSDLLAGISIVAAGALGEYLAGTLVVLMLSGGEALEAFATRSASSVLQALAMRMPSVAHRRENGALRDVPLEEIRPGDTLVVLPHEICPVDGFVIEGHGSMDEAYLTGEPYRITKAPGALVLSGAINGENALVVRCERPASDSRYARLMRVMREAEQHRPRLRRIGDQLGAWYTPVALGMGLIAWIVSHDPVRFLAVVVVATPCPLLIAIPVAIIGAISLAARNGIVIKDPAVLEKISTCRTALLDKTGTLTYGRPELVDVLTAPGVSREEALRLAASLEQYSRHPLARAIRDAAEQNRLTLSEATAVREWPGQGLQGIVEGHAVHITSRHQVAERYPGAVPCLPPPTDGMECILVVDNAYAATCRFRDEPRPESAHFVGHLTPRHGFRRVLLISGDRESEARYLAERVGITEIYAGQSPEQKLELTRMETRKACTIFVGDGINDAPAMAAATVGIAFGSTNQITSEAAGAVILDGSLDRVDVLMHIGARMRRIALQSAAGGMLLSLVGMGLATAGALTPVGGAIMQEVIDLLAVFNALRAAMSPRTLSDYGEG
ncbi:MAG: heavy metal translocating P-type ATPase [Chloroherpetonaceae bacterium]|nr:heavy metal translocating P-type ATPase [Chthonomonadaceae bacterium]MDW8207404.1 heavy metal translocating P-type ATPase [Chloroherpetonaceae bacterium]